MKKIVNLVILVPLAIVLIVLCVANRQSVLLALNPFRPDDPMLSVAAPFFVFLLLSFVFGVVVGGLAIWFSQAKYRKRARIEARSAVKWQGEADKQKKRADHMAAVATGLPQIPSKG
ncbi:LapA family protein [Allorhizobium sp. BGMRC 0089]|uniref:LapA family protein n=1 Tax=Allorhizobium sonneratiae TaxID=2934936 RepID=UPI0020340F45|nr:LapA family protein [Allorhizobium sonneratiae]MCM2291573.1 LapA family protein [Allorhizobium sonneratiae]